MTLNDGYSYRQVLGADAEGQTVHAYLVQAFAHSSAPEWAQRLLAGEVRLNGATAVVEQLVRPGQVLIWDRPPWQEEQTPLTYRLVHQDQDLLIVDKPSGLPTLPGGGFYRNTLLHRVQADFPAARPVHRLGRGTSGLVLFALRSEIAADLQRGWSAVEKQYQALASAVASQDEYDIRCPIGPVPHERLGRVHAARPAGKASRSVARVMERRLDSTVFEVDLHTGRPHQIRIHLAYIGHPLVGDPLYTLGGIPRADRPGLPGEGGYFLHAKRLRFSHPSNRQAMEFRSPPPGYL